MEKTLTTEITQNLEFKDCKVLRNVEVHFTNGYFQWLSFNVNNSNLYEFRNYYDGIKELHEVLGQIIEMVEKNKEEVREIITKNKGRLIRLDNADNDNKI